MLHEDEIGQDESNEERAEEQYSQGALISVGLFMLAIGLFFGWMVGRADQPTTVANAPVPTT
ncbi:MAG: hypothetical protein KDE51_13780, partial [Anaerolineales bacterium]|nr:hypothetical protein [Anaerolineales bacterium]